MMNVRLIFEPSCTTVCIGISTAGGSTVAMIASSNNPPAAPVETPRNAVTNEAMGRPKKTTGVTSGIPRNSNSASPRPGSVGVYARIGLALRLTRSARDAPDRAVAVLGEQQRTVLG